MAKRKKAKSQKPGSNSDAPEIGELVPQPHGGAIKYGSNGNPGAGRPPDEFKRKMREMASRDDVLAYLDECLRGEHGAKAAISAHRHITERGYGKVPQTIEGGEEPIKHLSLIKLELVDQ